MKFQLAIMTLSIMIISCEKSVFHNNGEALLTYEQNGRFGYINRSGEIVLEAKYLDADLFYEGLAAVEDPITRSYGFIDTKGIYIVPPLYHKVGRFLDGSAPVKKNNTSKGHAPWGLINKRGDILIDSIYRKFPSYEHYSDGVFNIPNHYYNSKTPYCHAINTKGDTILENKFNDIGEFVNGITTARIQKGKVGLWGYINKKGEYLIEPKYEKAFDFKNSDITYAIRKENGVYCHFLINKKGEEIKQFQPLETLYKPRKDANGTIDSYQDLTKKRVPYYVKSVPKEQYAVLPTGSFYEGFALGQRCIISDAAYEKKLGRWSKGWHNEPCYIDTTGQILKLPKGIYPKGNFSEGFAAVYKINQKGEKEYGFINRKGEVVINPKYNTVYDFSEGLAGVKDPKTHRYNFIDTLGNEVIRQNFFDIDYQCPSFKNGVVKVQEKSIGGYNFINKKGEFFYKRKRKKS